MSDRRQRIHELVMALLGQQSDLELLSGDGSGFPGGDAGSWVERNRRVVQRYQALVRTAVTLDALMDQEIAQDPLPPIDREKPAGNQPPSATG
ncbi:hypothetical protein NZK32_00605 [Cyanobium sp. FGCU-52]|nr:hypothetical protein [Cyanobium sp. FGCU52]